MTCRSSSSTAAAAHLTSIKAVRPAHYKNSASGRRLFQTLLLKRLCLRFCRPWCLPVCDLCVCVRSSLFPLRRHFYFGLMKVLTIPWVVGLVSSQSWSCSFQVEIEFSLWSSGKIIHCLELNSSLILCSSSLTCSSLINLSINLSTSALAHCQIFWLCG